MAAGDPMDYCVFDTDENKVVLFGESLDCFGWAERLNGKVRAAGGEDCFVAQRTFVNNRTMRVTFNNGDTENHTNWLDVGESVDEGLANGLLCESMVLEDADGNELASIEVEYSFLFNHVRETVE